MALEPDSEAKVDNASSRPTCPSGRDQQVVEDQVLRVDPPMRALGRVVRFAGLAEARRLAPESFGHGNSARTPLTTLACSTVTDTQPCSMLGAIQFGSSASK